MSLSFSDALVAIKEGKRLAREGWNGKGMFVFLVAGSRFKVNRKPLLGPFPEGRDVVYRGHIDLVAADGSVGPWSASNTDLLADDWVVVGEE